MESGFKPGSVWCQSLHSGHSALEDAVLCTLRGWKVPVVDMLYSDPSYLHFLVFTPLDNFLLLLGVGLVTCFEPSDYGKGDGILISWLYDVVCFASQLALETFSLAGFEEVHCHVVRRPCDLQVSSRSWEQSPAYSWQEAEDLRLTISRNELCQQPG